MINPLSYPRLSYSPGLSHSAFNITLMASVQKDFDTHKESLADAYRRWPSIEQISQELDDEQITRLSSFINDDSYVGLRKPSGEDYPGILVESEYPVFAPTLSIQLNSAYLDTDLHNAATPNLFLGVLGFGLPALKQVYMGFDMPDIVPKIHLDESNTLEFTSPFILHEETYSNRAANKPDPMHTKFLEIYDDVQKNSTYGEEYTLDDVLVTFTESEHIAGSFLTRQAYNSSGIILQETQKIISASEHAYQVTSWGYQY